MPRPNHTLPTQLEAGLRRWERPLREAAKRAAWATRLDPAQYTCTRSGRSWLAECAAAGQVFEFSRDEGGDVRCLSGSGSTYALRPTGERWECCCPAAEKARQGLAGDRCKHEVALEAVCGAARQEKAAKGLARVQAPAAVALGSEEEDAAREAQAA